jgi:hypothetical protein
MNDPILGATGIMVRMDRQGVLGGSDHDKSLRLQGISQKGGSFLA